MMTQYPVWITGMPGVSSAWNKNLGKLSNVHTQSIYFRSDTITWVVFNIVDGFIFMGSNFYTPVFRRDVLWYGDVRPSVRPSGSPSVRHSFPQISPICFEILSWNFVYHFIFMHVRSSSNAINFRQFLLELCPFWNLEYWKYTVFNTFLLHASTYWAEMLHMTLFHCTTDQVWVSSFSVNFCGSYAPLGTYSTENTQFSALFSYMLWHIELNTFAYDFA